MSAKIIKNLSNFNRVIGQMQDAGRLRVVVGAPGTPHGDGLTDGQLLAIHEYGNQWTPERSVLRSTLREERKAVLKQLAKDNRKVARGSMTVRQSLGRAGLYLEGQVKRKFGSSELAPLAPSTRRRAPSGT